MRAARLLQMLLLLQNRGRMTSAQLAQALEVTSRTILRDVDAMTEAGLPIIVYQGNQGGIELGFNYRTRLTGLAADEAEALGLMLAAPLPALKALGMSRAAEQARAKLTESFPDIVRKRIKIAQARFRLDTPPADLIDPRVEAIAIAVRGSRIVRLNATSAKPQIVHPCALVLQNDGWAVLDVRGQQGPISITAWNDINISAKTFTIDV